MTIKLKRRYSVWKRRCLLAAGLLICTSLRAGNTPQTPLILSLPLAQLSLWDTKSTEAYVEQLQGNKKANNQKKPWSEKQINHARFLFSRLQRDKIVIKKTLPALLVRAKPAKRSSLCRRCLHYFLHAGRGENSTTGGLTSMFKRKFHIKEFVKRPLNSIRRVARSSPLSVITSIYSNRGFPASSQKVMDFLSWEFWWRQEGDEKILDRELLRAISSMLSGRGLPKAHEVKTYLDLDVWWQQKGDKKILDRELLRAISSMLSGRGLPKTQEVKDYLELKYWWQQEGDKKILNRKLLRVLSSMFHGKGLPSAQAVKDYLELDVWWQQKGDKRIMDWELLQAFSSVFHGNGLPDISQSRELLDWLSVDGQPDRCTVDLLRNLYSAASPGHRALGLPDLDCLKLYEQNLYAQLQGSTGEREGDGAEDAVLNTAQIRHVALYLANIEGTRKLHWPDCVAFLDGLPCGWFHDPLETLYTVLRLHGGGPGVQAWLSVLKAGVPEKTQTFLLREMMQGVPLATARYAVDHIDPREWQDYITVTRYFGRCPDSDEWTRIKGYLRTWHDILPRRDLQIRYLTLVQRFPGPEREFFLTAEYMQAVLKSLPSLHMMTRLAKTCSDKELMGVFQACLYYDRAMKSGRAPAFPTLSRLFNVLLKIQSPFYLRPPQPLPGQVLSSIEDDPDFGVIISANPGAGIQDSETLIWQFLVTVMDTFSDVEYEMDKRWITLSPHGSDHAQTFPIPVLSQRSNGLHILNWSKEDLLRFFRATECDKTLCMPSEGGRDGRTVHDPRRKPHQQRQNIARRDVPGTLRDYLVRQYSEPEPENTGNKAGYLLELLTQDATAFEPEPELPPHSVEDLITAACRRDVLNLAELEELMRFKEQLTLEQAIQIIQRIPAFVPESVVSQWTDLQQEKATRAMVKDPLLPSPDKDILSTPFDGSHDWLEAL